MTDLDIILDALTAIRDTGLCTDRAQLNQAWRDLTKPIQIQEELHP